ncbi:MAG: hypothetical protein ACRDL6_11575 [Solirubrobacterales bacterium]
MTMGESRTHTATNPRDRRAERTGEARREERRREMQDAEGHAGSTPRGNQNLEREKTDERRVELERLLGH